LELTDESQEDSFPDPMPLGEDRFGEIGIAKFASCNIGAHVHRMTQKLIGKEYVKTGCLRWKKATRCSVKMSVAAFIKC
jgi:hypothetical protein